MIDAVVFDWGGVLVGVPHPSRSRRLERLLGVRPRSLDTFFEWGTFYTKDEWIRVTSGSMSETEFWLRVCERLPRPPARHLAIEVFDHVVLTPARPAMTSLLRELGKRVRLALLSNATPSLRRVVEAMEVFDQVVISAEVGTRKPDVSIFRHVLCQLGVPAQRALFVDDAEHNVAVAARIGFVVHHFRNIHTLRSALARLDLLPRSQFRGTTDLATMTNSVL
jgi:putative hydrolase of the HAD superfamily